MDQVCRFVDVRVLVLPVMVCLNAVSELIYFFVIIYIKNGHEENVIYKCLNVGKFLRH